MESAHLNGIRTDCILSNLKWATPKENASHRILHGTHLVGEKHGSAKLSDRDVATIREREDLTAHELSRLYGVTPQHVYLIRRGKSRTEVTT